jgi:hypothetical protein
VFCSRKLERAPHDSVAFRVIAANQHPDHDTIANFRHRFLPQIEKLFVQVLSVPSLACSVAREMGVLKLGTMALDGTKIHANASRHSALSYEHATKIEAQLKAEVADLSGKAEAAEMQVPEELARREKRLAEIACAKAIIEARAKERFARERAEYEAKMAARDSKAAQTGQMPRDRTPQPAVAGLLPSDQVNLTDEESRIMPVAKSTTTSATTLATIPKCPVALAQKSLISAAVSRVNPATKTTAPGAPGRSHLHA